MSQKGLPVPADGEPRYLARNREQHAEYAAETGGGPISSRTPAPGSTLRPTMAAPAKPAPDLDAAARARVAAMDKANETAKAHDGTAHSGAMADMAEAHTAPTAHKEHEAEAPEMAEMADVANPLAALEAAVSAAAEASDSSIVKLAVSLDTLKAQTLDQGETLSDAACAAIVLLESSADGDNETKLGIRYSPALGWLSWRGKRKGWLPVPGDATKRKTALLAYVNSVLTAEAAAMLEAANDALQAAEAACEADKADKQAEAELDRAAKALGYAKREARTLSSAKKARDVVDLLATNQTVLISAEELAEPPELLACPSGVVDLATGIMRPYRHSDMMLRRTVCDPAPPGASIEGRLLERCLNDWAQGDTAVIGYLQAFAGYAATGYSDAKRLLAVVGPKDTGKSQLPQMLSGVLGDYAALIPLSVLVRNGADAAKLERDTAKLHNVRFAYVSEVDEGTHWNAAVMKSITGSDPLSGKFLYANSFDFEPTHTVMLVANDLPVFRSTVDEALMERLAILPFDKQIPKAERQEDVWRRIVEDEGPLLLRWIIDGAQRVIADRLPVLQNVPAAMQAAKAEYRAEASPFDMWLAERCVFAANAKARQPDLNADLKQWLEANGKRAISRKVLRTKLEEMAEARGLECVESGGKRVYVWHGIGLAAEGEPMGLSPLAFRIPRKQARIWAIWAIWA